MTVTEKTVGGQGMGSNDYRRQISSFFYPRGSWAGWSRFFEPTIPSRLFSEGFQLIREALSDCPRVDGLVEFLSQSHVKKLSEAGRGEVDVTCYPTDVAREAVDLLKSLSYPEPESAVRLNAISAIEEWISGEKCRSASIEIDDGYGATCWRVRLHRGKNFVSCVETNFVAQDGVDPQWCEHEGNLYCCVDDGNLSEDWPGLERTIIHAIESANKFWSLHKN